MKVALVCDWLTNVGGAEKVILRIHKLFPDAPIYTSKYDPKGIDWFLDADVRTGWLQRFPTKLRRILGPLRQRYFSKLDLSEYDLVISITGAEAKAVKVPNGVHISYCHVPTQYYWQMYDDYIKNPGFGIFNPVVRFFFKLMVKPLRKADFKSAQSPDYFITISEYAREQILKFYKREATVIHPPVEISDFKIKKEKSQIESFPQGTTQVVENFDITKSYITTSRQVNWKRIDLVIEACLMTKNSLLIIGEGPEHKKLVKLADGSELVKFLPLMKKNELAKCLALAKGYLFPSLEPFGIAPVEALASGCPVIAFSEGGAKDYVVDGENGVLFKKQTAEAMAKAIRRFEKMKFKREEVSLSADRFDEKRFDKEIKEFIREKVK
ncbi:glycosyltransferase [Candidatus Saccharibacteria bacterium]|nr:glycosyltransferase [Candidatus Saccharibacteria bacterium]